MRNEHRVLLIEDNDVDAAVFERYVCAMPGWRVLRVRSLEEAEEKVEELGTNHFDLVAVDLTLPDAVDLEAIHFAREQIPTAVCVAVTARNPDEVDERALRSGAADLLVKGQMNARGVQRAISHAVDRNKLVRRQLESERNLRSMLGAWTDALFVLNTERRVVFANEAAASIAPGLTEGEGEEPVFTLDIQPGDVLQTVLQSAKGEELPVEVRSWRLSWADDPAQAVLVRDRRAERGAERARKLAEAGKGALEGVHDIGNRIQAMLGTLRDAQDHLALVDGTTKADLEVSIARMRAQVEQIAHVVRTSRDGAKHVRKRRIPVDVAALVRSSCQDLRPILEPVAGLRLQLEPGCEVRGEPFDLTRVVDNLLKNAAEAVDGGDAENHEIRVSVRREGKGVLVEVEDTGPGIPASLRTSIFKEGVTGKANGTGFGLANVQRIVQEHEGRIEVLSPPGQGACFRIVLPATERRTSDISVLLLEDQPDVARANERLLRDHFSVRVGAHGLAGLALLAEDPDVHVILCDLDMPELDGPGFYEALADAHPGLRERVVFCTGGATSTEIEAFLDSTGRPRLHKPLDLSEALAVIESVADAEAV